jgi:hypothetical protein
LSYCTDCLCLDCTETCATACSNPVWQGDGFCDDNNNHCGCDWDGGDCCGADMGLTYAYCLECACRDPESACPTSGTCSNAAWVGDGFCDDGNNNCNCDWDNGDCCGENGKQLQYAYCSSCACADPSYIS